MSSHKSEQGEEKSEGFCLRYEGRMGIFSGLKDESRWKKRFSDLKTEFKNRPAFLDEVRKL